MSDAIVTTNNSWTEQQQQQHNLHHEQLDNKNKNVYTFGNTNRVATVTRGERGPRGEGGRVFPVQTFTK